MLTIWKKKQWQKWMKYRLPKNPLPLLLLVTWVWLISFSAYGGLAITTAQNNPSSAGNYTIQVNGSSGSSIFLLEPSQIVWKCPIGHQSLIAPYPGAGRPFLSIAVNLNKVICPVDWFEVFWLDETTGEWKYYISGFTQNTLLTLKPDQYYWVVVSAPCELIIPQYTPSEPDYLSMSKDELFHYLTSGAVARDWWNLSYQDRRELAVKIIELWTCTIGRTPFLSRGDPNSQSPPDWNPFLDPHPSLQWLCHCGESTGIRYCLLCGDIPCPLDIYYFRDSDEKWYCEYCSDAFHLPVFRGIAILVESNFVHFFPAMQIGEDMTDFNSWVFFQYETADIKPGDWQMPHGATVRVCKPKAFTEIGTLEIYPNPILAGEWRVP